jgi:nicotinamide-nucleotide amidase
MKHWPLLSLFAALVVGCANSGLTAPQVAPPSTIIHQPSTINHQPSTSPAPHAKPLDYLVVVTGGELLEGVYPDAHTPFLTRTLRPLGCRCVGAMIVDDVRDKIEAGLQFATNHAALVIVTGGLGPTPNDLTRETLSEFTGIPLREDPDVLAQLEKRFQHPNEPLRPNLRKQCLVPARGGYLKNANGTAVGLIFDQGPTVIVALPGPPRELQPMVRDELVPYLRRRFGVHALGAALTLRFVGAGQSLIDQTLKDHIAVAPDVTITSLFEGSRVDFFFTLPGNAPEDQARLQRLEENIREHLAEYIYADDSSTLEEVVCRKLLARGGPLALVEIGSGGQLAAALSRVKGIERLLAGAYLGPSATAVARLLGIPQAAPSIEQQLREMAAAAARLTHSQAVIATGPVETDAKGNAIVRVLFQLGGVPPECQPLSLRDTGEIARNQLATQILDGVRRRLK